MGTNYLWTGASSTVFSTAGNFTPSGPPADGDNGDTLTLNQSATQGIDGTVNAAAKVLTLLTIKGAFTGTVGDLATPFRISAKSVAIGEPASTGATGSGSGRINLYLDAGTDFTGTILGTGTATDTGLEAVRLKGGSASSKLYVTGPGSIGLATNAIGDTLTLAELDVTDSGAVVYGSSGLTWTTLYQTAGTVTLNSGGTTATLEGGTLTLQGTGTLTTLNVAGGTAVVNLRADTTGTLATITTLNVYGGAVVDFSDIPSPVKITTVNLYGGGQIKRSKANPGHVVITTLNLLNADTLAAN